MGQRPSIVHIRSELTSTFNQVIMKKTLFFLAISALVVSCEKDPLDLAPISEVGSNGFYTNGDEIELATIAIYDGLQAVPLREFALTEMRSDNTESKSSEGDWGQFERFAVTPTNLATGDYWSANYNVIFRANRVLENLDVVEDPSRGNQFEGEARFCRALAHFNLVRAYGDVPLLDKTILQTESSYFDRDLSETVYAFIVQDLQAASSLLPMKGSVEYGRATSGAAEALLAKVFLTTGDYAAAQSSCEAVISSGDYVLEPSYYNIFYPEELNPSQVFSDEVIFAIPYEDDDGIESQDFSFEMTAGGVRAGLNYLTDDFLAGLSPLDTARIAALRNPVVPLEVGKFITNSSNARLCGNDWIVLRLADVYLMHVEAIMAGFPSTQNLDAIASFNAVRSRVGMDSIAVDGTGEITLEVLLNERRYELAFENHRLYDLVRTGQAQTVLSNFASSQGYTFTSTDLLLPIPQAEINVSEGLLKQNPGY